MTEMLFEFRILHVQSHEIRFKPARDQSGTDSVLKSVRTGIALAVRSSAFELRSLAIDNYSFMSKYMCASYRYKACVTHAGMSMSISTYEQLNSRTDKQVHGQWVGHCADTAQRTHEAMMVEYDQGSVHACVCE